MPTIGNNNRTLLDGLSDFWTRFYKDSDELKAMYQGMEVLTGQAYLDMLSGFLNISITETPIFNKEFFKLLTFREDDAFFDKATNAADDRYVLPIPDNVVSAHILQNKVINPTASLEVDAGYELNLTDDTFRFAKDPTGTPGVVIGETLTGTFLTFAGGPLGRFYVSASETLFGSAKAGDYFRVLNSGSGNDGTYVIARVLDPQTALLQGTFTLPDANNGNLVGRVLSSEFKTEMSFARRSVIATVGGSFDDAVLRATADVPSWALLSPSGLDIRKGDILRLLTQNSAPTIPVDLTIDVVRHDKLYISTETPLLKDFTGVTHYALLRDGANSRVIDESSTFLQVNQTASGANASFVNNGSNKARITVPTAPFVLGDQQRFLTVFNTDVITWTANIALRGEFTFSAGIAKPLARASVDGQVTISGSAQGNNGTYNLSAINANLADGTLDADFVPEAGLTFTLVSVTNAGTYRIRTFVSTTTVEIDREASFPDNNNGSIGWQLHDGYRVNLTNTRLVRGSVSMLAGLGDSNTGGRRAPVIDTDFVVDYENGTVLQVGRLAGTWGASPAALISYTWLEELYVRTGTGAGVLTRGDTEISVNEVAMWAPDAQVDRFNLYNNYGYLINRFAPSSEQYREFIRGVFQLYILGPTLERIESALNVIAQFPVVRDDGEVLSTFDTSDPTVNVVVTRRPNGDIARYEFPTTLALRDDVQDPANFGVLTFESFEPLSLAFIVSDYVQDPAWWTDIVVPAELMPSESLGRRRAVPSLFDNIVNPTDAGRVGDPGFFVGADDEGIVPPFIATHPAKRRKMANVVFETFLKYNVFFVRFDPTTSMVLTPEFLSDLMELILIAKPGYKFLFLEPFQQFEDIMLIEEDLEVGVGLLLGDTMAVGENTLTVQSMTWNVGDVWRYAALVMGEALAVANGIVIPNGGAPINLVGANLLGKDINGPSPLQEDVDYAIDYEAGTVTPKTIWPAGAYTIDYRKLVLTPQGSKDPSLGDTDFVIGGPDPQKTHTRREPIKNSSIGSSGLHARTLVSSVANTFSSALHVGQHIHVLEPLSHAGRYKIERVINGTTSVLDNSLLTPVGNVVWTFPSEEPSDGVLVGSGTAVTSLTTPSGMFLPRHVGRYVRIADATNSVNNGRHRIQAVISPSQITVVNATGGVFIGESGIHWRMEGTQAQMDLVERPLQIAIS